MAEKFLSESGFAYYDGKQKERLAKKADLDALPKKLSELVNDAGFITDKDIPEGAAASATVPKMDGTAAAGTENAFARGDHVHPTDTTRLGTTGDASQVTVSFNPAAEKASPESGETLAVMMGKLAKTLAELGALANKDGVTSDDLDAAIKASLAKADTALQSFTETDPTVPAWAKEAVKPSYTAAEVGAIPAAEAETFAKKSELSRVFHYMGSVDDMEFLNMITDNAVGDVWDVKETGMNYAWNGREWDALGQVFEVQAMSAAEIDAIMNA